MQRVHYKLLVIQHGGASEKPGVYTHRHWTFNAIWSQYACSIGGELFDPGGEARRGVGQSNRRFKLTFLPSFGQFWNVALLSDLNQLCRLYVYTPRSVKQAIQSVFLIYVRLSTVKLSVYQSISCLHLSISYVSVFHQLDAKISISCVCVLFDQL